MQKFISSSPAETEQIAAEFAKTLRGGEVLAFRGGLGMGKTCFTRGLAAGLGIDPAEVSSPTFALVNEYRGGRLPLYGYGSREELTAAGACFLAEQPADIADYVLGK